MAGSHHVYATVSPMIRLEPGGSSLHFMVGAMRGGSDRASLWQVADGQCAALAGLAAGRRRRASSSMQPVVGPQPLVDDPRVRLLRADRVLVGHERIPVANLRADRPVPTCASAQRDCSE